MSKCTHLVRLPVALVFLTAILIFMLTSRTRMQSLNRKAKTEALADAVKKHKRFKSALPILDCRTPIVQLWDKRTRIKCDLSVCSSMGVLNTRFVKFCLDFDPRARLLAMVVKCFAKKHHITGLKNFDFFFLVIDIYRFGAW